MIELDAIETTKAKHEPFDFFVTERVLGDADLAAIAADFPAIDGPGVYPLTTLQYGPAFARLIEEIRSPELARIVGAKLGVELAGLPLMITVRGQAQARDGRIHTDTADKVATCLLYLNDRWAESGGRLRLLRNGHDLENYVAEVPPNGGVLAAFKVGDTSWHGHHPFVGKRRYVMFNWVRSQAALSRQLGRHRISAQVKKLLSPVFRARA